MITSLRMRNFKNFKDAELKLGPLTVLIGANASGKSNIRDAFRFLHGVGRGYTFAEIIGGKYGEGGAKIWEGIRGGVREIAFDDSEAFALEVELRSEATENGSRPVLHRVEVAVDRNSSTAHLLKEELILGDLNIFSYSDHGFRDTAPFLSTVGFAMPPEAGDSEGPTVDASILSTMEDRLRVIDLLASLPSLPGFDPEGKIKLSLNQMKYKKEYYEIKKFNDYLKNTSFLDLDPSSMREPSPRGQSLGDRGENLSSALDAICSDSQKEQTLQSWVSHLTPMEVADFEFPADQIGRVLVTLVEADGRKTTAYSASDGTLRFLALLAALLGPDPAKLYFIEEIENGLHPTRLSLLIELIERVAASRGIQIVATTHAPYLLGYMSRESLEHASLVYRTEGRPDARIVRIADMPNAMELIAKKDVAYMHASGWFENVASFMDDEEGDE
jgi:predicted ATPase